MRDESQAPRNSRELAVRNQFFTPRYVVQFLVGQHARADVVRDAGEGSGLAERCELPRAERRGAARARPKKDPRDIRILDPACGSGHFLLYCFDLLLTIYEEAWAAEASSARKPRDRPDAARGLPDLATLRRRLPALILAHNLHGVDIDPRAAQIAALALWLRAQRAWKDFAFRRRSDRPSVEPTSSWPSRCRATGARRGVCARLEPPLLRDLFRKMVSEMRLAGELGTLLRVDEAIAWSCTGRERSS